MLLRECWEKVERERRRWLVPIDGSSGEAGDGQETMEAEESSAEDSKARTTSGLGYNSGIRAEMGLAFDTADLMKREGCMARVFRSCHACETVLGYAASYTPSARTVLLAWHTYRQLTAAQDDDVSNQRVKLGSVMCISADLLRLERQLYIWEQP